VTGRAGPDPPGGHTWGKVCSRDHRSGYEQEAPALFRDALASVKQTLDPAGILNLGVLIDPVGKRVGILGAMARSSGGQPNRGQV